MRENILDHRVKGRNGYKLYETIELIKYEEQILEGTSIVGKGIQKGVTLAIMALLDDATGEISGFLALLPILYKNVYELHQTNKSIEVELNASNPDIDKLEELRKKLTTDVIDILNAIIIALPLPVIDTVAVPIVNFLEDSIATGAASRVSDLFSDLSKSNPKLAKLLHIISYPFGGPVILKSLVSIDKLSEHKIQMSIRGVEMVDDREDVGPIIDVTPDEMSEPPMLPQDIEQDLISETLKLDRMCLLAGI